MNNRYRFSSQFRFILLLHRSEKSVHIDVHNDSIRCPIAHALSASMLSRTQSCSVAL